MSDVSPAPPGYYEGLPTKHVSAGCLVRDPDGRVLLVKPTYKEPWELPGGTVEADESPRQACRREVGEELGVDLSIGDLLIVDYHHAVQGVRGDTLQLVFDGGVIGPDVADRIALPTDELSEWRFFAVDELDGYVIPAMAQRIRACVDPDVGVYRDGSETGSAHIVGLTGGIGAGKSTVARILATLGARVIDVDAIGREVLAPGGRAEQAVLDRFGPGIADPDGHIDRAALASVVFADRAQLAALEAISHPAINVEIDRRLDQLDDGAAPATTPAVTVLDMAILLGSRLGLDLPSGRRYTMVIAVEADEEVRVRRLVELRGMSERDARARIAAQPTDAERRAVADIVIVNDADPSSLESAVARVAAGLGVGGAVSDM